MTKFRNFFKIFIINVIILCALLILLEFVSRSRDNYLQNDTRFQKKQDYKEHLKSLKNFYGDSILPEVVPSYFHKEKLIPLGSVPNYYTLFPNENGYYPIYKNDRYGFNNIDKNYNKKIDAILIGDSFVHGCCVQQTENLSSIMTDLGLTTINFGAGDNSVLSELASYVEYADKFNSKYIIWFYYEGNDYWSIPMEVNSKILFKYYTNKEYSQDLINSQGEINETILKKFKNLVSKSFFQNFSLVKRLKYHLTNYQSKITSNEILFNVLERVNEDSINKNKNFLFVYLPSWDRYYNDEIFDPGIEKDSLLNYLESKKIRYYDFDNEIKNSNVDPKNYFSEPRGHYNSFGYKKVSEGLINKIKEEH